MAKKTSVIGAGLSELEQAFREAQAIKKAEAAAKKGPALPLNLGRAPAKTREEINAIAERVARQQLGEHVRGLKGADNLAGRSGKENKRIQQTVYNLERTKQIDPTVEVKGNVGDINQAVIGDQTISDFRLVDVNGIPIDSVQEGGPRYGLGKKDQPIPFFWASNLGGARPLQNKVNRLSELYDTDQIMGHHLSMGPVANNFALHFADANLKAIANSDVSAKGIKEFNKIIRERHPTFPGVENPEQSFLAMMEDSEMRKFFNDRMKTPSDTQPLGLPNGLDIQWAITEPELRNMEIAMSGHSVGRLKPGAELIEGADHNTYTHGIQGEVLGHAPELAPFEIAYPDADLYLRSVYEPKQISGTINMTAPHQKVDEQYLDQLNEYYKRLREIRGFAKGGKVGKAAGILEELNKAYEEAQALKAVQAVKSAPTITAPKRSGIKDVQAKVKEKSGTYGAQRVEQAADLVPNLEQQFTQNALLKAFTGHGDTAHALTIMRPSDFENWAQPLSESFSSNKNYSPDLESFMSYDEYIDYLARITRDSGFSDVPHLQMRKDEVGIPLKPYMTGHEGRHRNRALNKLGDKATLIEVLPYGDLRSGLPRQSQEEYIEALKKELEMQSLVRPEPIYRSLHEGDPREPKLFPKVFKDGGRAKLEQEFINADTVHMAEGGYRPVVGSPYGKGSGRPVTPQATLPDLDTIALTGKILAKKGAKQLKKELANPTPQMAADILGNLAADIIGMPSDLIEGVKGEPINTKGRNKPYNTSTMQQSKGKRMLGSENIRDQLKNAGITSGEERPLTEMGLGLIGPAAIAKGPKLAKALGKEAARRIEQNADNLGLKSYVVKPEGGQWSDTERNRIENVLTDPQGNPDVTNWLKTTGRKYVLNRMGTPEDEVRKLLDKDISHIDPKRLSEMGRDINQSDKDYIRGKRRVAGFPQEGFADTAAGKRWELMTDEYINPNPASVYQDERFTSEAPWAENLDPDTPIYSGERGTGYLFNETGMTEIANSLNRAIAEKKLKPEQLNKVSMEDAVKLAHEQRVKDETEIAKDLPKLLDYPEAGLSWHPLSHDDPEVLRKILKREGDTMQNCIGNYCEDITEDGTKLFSLRDKAGNPHVNIEMKPIGVKYEDFKKAFGEEKADELLDRYSPKELINLYPEFRRYEVKQIKGKQNEKPIKDYIPYVQDFIKQQGPFDRIDDLSNAGMIDLRRAQQHGVLDDSHPTVMQELGRLFPAEKDQFGGYVLSGEHGLRADTDVMLREALKGMEGNYVTADDIINHFRTQGTRPVEQGYSKYWDALNPQAEGMARGGQPKSIDLETQFRLADILTR